MYVFFRSPVVVVSDGAHRCRLCFVGVLTDGGLGSLCFVVLLWSSEGREWRGVYAGAPCGKLNARPFLEGMILVGGYSNVGAMWMNETGSLRAGGTDEWCWRWSRRKLVVSSKLLGLTFAFTRTT